MCMPQIMKLVSHLKSIKKCTQTSLLLAEAFPYNPWVFFILLWSFSGARQQGYLGNMLCSYMNPILPKQNLKHFSLTEKL